MIQKQNQTHTLRATIDETNTQVHGNEETERETRFNFIINFFYLFWGTLNEPPQTHSNLEREIYIVYVYIYLRFLFFEFNLDGGTHDTKSFQRAEHIIEYNILLFLLELFKYKQRKLIKLYFFFSSNVSENEPQIQKKKNHFE